MKHRFILSIVTSALFLSSGYAQVPAQVDLVQFANGFDKPVDIENAGDDRLFILEKDGLIRIVNPDGSINSTPFLNMQSIVTSGGLNSEQGLLGLAFHPDFPDNNTFYVNYTRTGGGDTYISRYNVSADPDIADVGSRVDILSIDQPFTNHNGGCLKFGPDGYLYIGTGDGGNGEDPFGYGQDMGEMLGKMLRIDIDGALPYEVPASNPFAGAGGDTLPEIWASGLRNPWRFSFDRSTGDLWIADVGQYDWEEVDFQHVDSPGGENYGWSCYEGTHTGFSTGCPPLSAFVSPVAEISHNGGPCSITGGYVYRGSEYPAFEGKYFFSDYCSGDIWTVEQNDADEWVTFESCGDQGTSVTSFGEDSVGELYLSNQSQGIIYKVTDGCAGPPPTITITGNTLTAPSGISHQWYFNGNAIDGANDMEYEATESGDYQVLVQFSACCSNFSEEQSVIVSSIAEITNDHGVSIIENPVDDILTIRFVSELQNGVVFKILDVTGAKVLDTEGGAGSTIWTEDVSFLPNGRYFLHISNEKGRSVISFIIAR